MLTKWNNIVSIKENERIALLRALLSAFETDVLEWMGYSMTDPGEYYTSISDLERDEC
jgi:exonuclease V gamma subunit